MGRVKRRTGAGQARGRVARAAAAPAGDRFRRALVCFSKRGGLLNTAAALRAGIHPATLYALRDAGTIEQLSRGLYRLAGGRPLSNPDLVTVAARVPRGVVCLLSALALHELTTQIPHEVQIALPSGAASPRLDYPPVRVFHFTGRAFTEGVRRTPVDGRLVRVYCAEKTLADCFKFRNKVGLDAAVEALRLYRERRGMDVAALMRYAAICRVDKVLRPYLEALL